MAVFLRTVCSVSLMVLVGACSDASDIPSSDAASEEATPVGSEPDSASPDASGVPLSADAASAATDGRPSIVDGAAGIDHGSPSIVDGAAGIDHLVEGGGAGLPDTGATVFDAGPVGPIGAVDISGTVVNQVWASIAGAQICLQGSSTCATSGPDGTFHIQGVGGLGLIVTAANYATSLYTPKTATEADDFVLLAAPGQNVALLFDGKTLDGWLQSSGTGIGNAPGTWNVQDASLHCVGTVRGTLVTAKEYGDYRLIFAVRQLPFTDGDDHYASVLIWGAEPPPNDALGALQFGTPNGYHWDYRPGFPGAGTAYFKQTSPGLSRTEWAQCEILTSTASGVARMACCSLTGTGPCKSTQVLQFTDPGAGKVGAIALQNHSPGGHDEYKNITLELSPSVGNLITE
jgi:Domain of Unknown Function (DUF1080)